MNSNLLNMVIINIVINFIISHHLIIFILQLIIIIN